MFRLGQFVKAFVVGGVCTVAVFAQPGEAQAAKFQVLYTFCSQNNCTDGATPGEERLMLDAQGNLYGTTWQGGSNFGGTVYKLAPDGTETVIRSFPKNFSTGYGPNGLVMDGSGNLFGTTESNRVGRQSGCGTAYVITATGTETRRHTFHGEPHDGCSPQGALAINAYGHLLGTTSSGGKYLDAGIAFDIKADGTENILHDFCSKGVHCTDGASPYGGLILDRKGNAYGTTEAGGNALCFDNVGCGVVFKLAPDGTETVLYRFQGPPNDGESPLSALIEDRSGNLYGTTSEGGIQSDYCDIPVGCGTVFKLAPDGTESVLFYFRGGATGDEPIGGLVEDAAGNLYGTTAQGGSKSNTSYGTVFEISPDGKETVLHRFTDQADGAYPAAGLVMDNSGHLYGTAQEGGGGYCSGSGCGTIFEVTP